MTRFRKRISVVKQVAASLYYLVEEDRMRKVTNSFGIGKSTVSKIIRWATQAHKLYYKNITLPLPLFLPLPTALWKLILINFNLAETWSFETSFILYRWEIFRYLPFQSEISFAKNFPNSFIFFAQGSNLHHGTPAGFYIKHMPGAEVSIYHPSI